MSGKFSEAVPLDQQVNFACNSCGNCCKVPIINVTFYDLAKIIENRPDLQLDDFVDFIDKDEDCSYGLKGNLFGRQLPVLKKKKGSCFFLDNNNRCTINAFKPLTCKTFPFKLENNNPVWEKQFYNFLNTKCGYTLEQNPEKKEEIINALKESEKGKQSFLKEIKNNNKRRSKEYTNTLSSLLNENFNLNSGNPVYELSSLDSPLIEVSIGKNVFTSKFYLCENDLLKPGDYEKFNHLIFTHVLENVRNPGEFINQLFIKINTNQKVLFIVKNSLNALFLKLILSLSGINYHDIENPGQKELNYFTLKSLKALFSENGLVIQDIIRYNRGYSPDLQFLSKVFTEISESYFDKTVLKDFETEKSSFCYIISVIKKDN